MSDVKEYEVTAKDLPLHCPTKEVALWASHPRVFLDIAKTGQVACPLLRHQIQAKSRRARPRSLTS